MSAKALINFMEWRARHADGVWVKPKALLTQPLASPKHRLSLAVGEMKYYTFEMYIAQARTCTVCTTAQYLFER